MFGIYAILRKKGKRWIFVPALLGFLWFFLALKIVIPYFAKERELYPGGFMFAMYYQHLGQTIPEMIKTIFLYPLTTIEFAFTSTKIAYLFQLFLPTGFLTFLSPGTLLMTILIFGQNLLSYLCIHSDIHFQYSLILLPFILASYINGLKRLLSYKVIYNYRAILLGVCLILSVISNLYLKAPQLLLTKYIEYYKIDEFAKEKDKLIKMIPSNASTIATFQFLPKLASRHNLYSMHFVSTGFKMYTNVKYEPPENLEYSLIDFNEPLLIGCFFWERSPDNIRNFLEKEDFRVLSAMDDIILFKKGYSDGKKLCEVVSEPKIENVVNANIAGKIILLGFDLQSKIIKPGNTLHLTYYWKGIEKIGKETLLLLEFIDSNGQIALQKFHTPGYRIYFPPDIFLQGAKKYQDRLYPCLKEEHWVYIPSDIRSQEYSLRMSIILPDGKRLPILSKEGIDDMGRIILSESVVVGLK
jgi:hypothetical protein